MRAALETFVGVMAAVVLMLFVSLFLSVPGAVIILILWLMLGA